MIYIYIYIKRFSEVEYWSYIITHNAYDRMVLGAGYKARDLYCSLSKVWVLLKLWVELA